MSDWDFECPQYCDFSGADVWGNDPSIDQFFGVDHESNRRASTYEDNIEMMKEMNMPLHPQGGHDDSEEEDVVDHGNVREAQITTKNTSRSNIMSPDSTSVAYLTPSRYQTPDKENLESEEMFYSSKKSLTKEAHRPVLYDLRHTPMRALHMNGLTPLRETRLSSLKKKNHGFTPKNSIANNNSGDDVYNMKEMENALPEEYEQSLKVKEDERVLTESMEVNVSNEHASEVDGEILDEEKEENANEEVDQTEQVNEQEHQQNRLMSEEEDDGSSDESVEGIEVAEVKENEEIEKPIGEDVVNIQETQQEELCVGNEHEDVYESNSEEESDEEDVKSVIAKEESIEQMLEREDEDEGVEDEEEDKENEVIEKEEEALCKSNEIQDDDEVFHSGNGIELEQQAQGPANRLSFIVQASPAVNKNVTLISPTERRSSSRKNSARKFLKFVKARLTPGKLMNGKPAKATPGPSKPSVNNSVVESNTKKMPATNPRRISKSTNGISLKKRPNPLTRTSTSRPISGVSSRKTETTPQGERYKSMAELVAEFENTPRFHRSHSLNRDVSSSSRARSRSSSCSSVTRAVSPRLLAKNRQRQCSTKQEQDDLIAQQIKKYTFKANPLNKKLFDSKYGASGVPKVKSGKQPTKSVGMSFQTEKRHEAWSNKVASNNVKVEEKFVFKARPLPSMFKRSASSVSTNK